MRHISYAVVIQALYRKKYIKKVNKKQKYNKK